MSYPPFTLKASRIASVNRALAADRKLRALDHLVRGLTEFVRPSDTCCTGCVWSQIVKPLATPLVGWGRGYPQEPADDPREGDEIRVYIGSENLPKRTPATTDTERWLRTQEAWDAVTGHWLEILDKADAANGHGICRRRRPAR